MPCPNCDHTMHGIGDQSNFWCPRCGTLLSDYNYGREPDLVRHETPTLFTRARELWSKLPPLLRATAWTIGVGEAVGAERPPDPPNIAADYFDPIDVGVALSLYGYNVSAADRAAAIFNHFKGNCAEPEELAEWCSRPDVVTALPYPSAEVYVTHALEMYGREARRWG